MKRLLPRISSGFRAGSGSHFLIGSATTDSYKTIAMSDRQGQRGRITKIVRVPFASFASGEPDSELFSGYGILRSAQGKDVFFVGTVVVNRMFESLDIGDEVGFVLEPGPLLRAARVWVQPTGQELQSPSMYGNRA